MPSTWATDCGGIWALCGSGTHQSPIDIDTSTVVPSEELNDVPLIVQYQQVYHSSVVNLGTTIHVNMGTHNNISGGPLPTSDVLILKQFHFHAPGEHRINGAQSSAEVHLVHETSDGLVRAVLVVRVMTGTTNHWFDSILAVRNLPVGANTTIDINPLQLFPSSLVEKDGHLMTHSNYYSYNGSLTTPPCTEGVYWIVLADPIYASTDQIDSLERWEGINNRPIQVYNGTVYRPGITINTPASESEDIRYMGMVIGVSFLLGLVSFFGIIAIAIVALHFRDVHDKRDFYGAQQFELQPTNY